MKTSEYILAPSPQQSSWKLERRLVSQLSKSLLKSNLKLVSNSGLRKWFLLLLQRSKRKSVGDVHQRLDSKTRSS